jgi:parallel beta-helix repeat protein
MVKNCTSHDNRHRGIQAQLCSYPTVDNCTVYECANYAPYNRGLDVPWCAALIFDQTDNGMIKDCTVYHNYGEGINLRRSTYGTIQDCISGMNMRTGIYMDQTHTSTCQRNFVYGVPTSEFINVSPPCITLGQEAKRIGWYSHDNVVINNICVGGSRSFQTVNQDTTHGVLVDATIANNVFYEPDAGGYALRISNDANNSGSVFRNNIVVVSQASVVSSAGGLTGVTFDHNCWYGTQPPSGYKSGSDITSDPRFRNPDAYGACAKDSTRYKLQGTSPCIGAGVALATVTEDFWGTDRRTPPSMGVHEPA